MKLPRDWSGEELAQRLKHHVTIPRHQALRTGTLTGVLDDVAAHFQITRAELLDRIS